MSREQVIHTKGESEKEETHAHTKLIRYREPNESIGV